MSICRASLWPLRQAAATRSASTSSSLLSLRYSVNRSSERSQRIDTSMSRWSMSCRHTKSRSRGGLRMQPSPIAMYFQEKECQHWLKERMRSLKYRKIHPVKGNLSQRENKKRRIKHLRVSCLPMAILRHTLRRLTCPWVPQAVLKVLV